MRFFGRSAWRTARGLLLSLLLLTCAACGFALRGDVQLPPELQVMQVQVEDRFSPLQHNLEQALARAGARAPQAEEAAAVLRITNNRLARWPLSIGAVGRVQEYVMRYEVTLQLNDAAGTEILPRQSIQLERSYQFETSRAQGTPGEEDVVRAELERDMTQTILRRIQSVLAAR